MEFTQINEISSILNIPFSQKLAKNILLYATKLTKIKNEHDMSNEQQYNQLMKNLQEINSQKAINLQSLPDEQNHFYTPYLSLSPKQSTNTQPQQQQQFPKLDKSRSIIFKSSFDYRLQNNHNFKNNSSQQCIKIYYFNKPIYKLIQYYPTTTIKQIISLALDEYFIDNYDAIKINQPIESKKYLLLKILKNIEFQIKLPISQDNHQADYDIQSIHYDRHMNESMFNTLVLVEKTKKQDYLHSKTTKQYSQQQSTSSWSNKQNDQINSNQTILITLKDQTYFQLLRMEVQINGTLEKIFRTIQQNNLINTNNFVLKQDPQSQFDLSRDQQVKLLQSTRLYVLPKKFIDAGDQDQDLRPIRLKTLIQPQVSYLPPIGINQASKYQQFTVTKISSMGIAIDRTIGIDQTKLYNYGKQIRQHSKQVSLLDKFLGMDKESGTKRPYRKIEDIQEIKRFYGGFEIVYHQKVTTYLVKNENVLDRIVRKLTFLIKTNKKGENKNK